MTFRRKTGYALLPLLFALPFAFGFSETEFACEEAYQHLEDCCGSAPEGIGCETSCNSQPSLNLQEGDCLRRASCDELKAAGACAPEAVALGKAMVCQ
jgi:hypothetical protein